MKNEKTLRASMDRRLSFLDGLPSCRPALMQRIAQEEEPVMKKKLSVSLVLAIVIVSLSVAGLAAGLLLSPRVSAARLADRALEETYGVTERMQTFFGREETELEDGSFIVTYTGAGTLEAPLGTYTAVVRGGKAEVTWSHDGADCSGGYEAEAWGAEQLRQMLADYADPQGPAYAEAADRLYAAAHPEGEGAESAEPDESGESVEEYHERREAEKNAALAARKLTEEEMTGIAREFIISTYSLTDAQVSLLELISVSNDPGDNNWYEIVGGKNCFLVEYLMDDNPDDDEVSKHNAYFKVYVNVETGVIEQYEYNSGLGGIG